jgi:hypothetical protein
MWHEDTYKRIHEFCEANDTYTAYLLGYYHKQDPKSAQVEHSDFEEYLIHLIMYAAAEEVALEKLTAEKHAQESAVHIPDPVWSNITLGEAADRIFNHYEIALGNLSSLRASIFTR